MVKSQLVVARYCSSLVGVQLSCAELYFFARFKRWHAQVRATRTPERVAQITLQKQSSSKMLVSWHARSIIILQCSAALTRYKNLLHLKFLMSSTCVY